MGANTFANSLDHSDVRLDIRKAMKECDEVFLSTAIDVARAIGFDYPYRQELDEAETFLYELLQCPDQPLPKQKR